jgi:hypothetical protein
MTHFTHDLRWAMLTVLRETVRSWSESIGKKMHLTPRIACEAIVCRTGNADISARISWSGRIDTLGHRSNHIEPLTALFCETGWEKSIIACGDNWVESSTRREVGNILITRMKMLEYRIEMKSMQAILEIAELSHLQATVIFGTPHFQYGTLTLIHPPFSWQSQDVTVKDRSISSHLVSIRSNRGSLICSNGKWGNTQVCIRLSVDSIHGERTNHKRSTSPTVKYGGSCVQGVIRPWSEQWPSVATQYVGM